MRKVPLGKCRSQCLCDNGICTRYNPVMLDDLSSPKCEIPSSGTSTVEMSGSTCGLETSGTLLGACMSTPPCTSPQEDPVLGQTLSWIAYMQPSKVLVMLVNILIVSFFPEHNRTTTNVD